MYQFAQDFLYDKATFVFVILTVLGVAGAIIGVTIAERNR